MALRIYHVHSPSGDHLVEAVSRQAALAHVAKTTMSVWVPSQKFLIELVAKGVQLENAREDYDSLPLPLEVIDPVDPDFVPTVE